MDLSPNIVPELNKGASVSQNKAFLQAEAEAKAKAEDKVGKPCIYQPQMECRPGELNMCEKCPELSGRCWPPMLGRVFEKIKGLAIGLLNQERKA